MNHPDQPGADARSTPFIRGLVDVFTTGFPRSAAEVWPVEIHGDVMRAAAPRHEALELLPAARGMSLTNRFPGASAIVGAAADSRDVAPIRGASVRGDHAAALARAVALDVRLTARHGDGHPDTLPAREVRAHVSAQAGCFAEAVELYRDVAERRADVLGVDHSEVRAAADGAHAA